MTRYFYGWNVLGATVVVAFFSFGVGFYGIAAYVAALQRAHGWSAAVVSAPVTVYYIAGAILSAWMAVAYDRFGPRVVVTIGTIAMAGGVSALGMVRQPWHLYPLFLVMAIGWGSMSGAALNIIVAPWFERHRGLAVSIAFTGATLGGVVVVPTLIALIASVGLADAVLTAAVVMLAVVLPVAIAVLRSGPDAMGLGPDGGPRVGVPSRRPAKDTWRAHARVLRTWPFWSVSAPFALGLAAQLGVLTHQVALLTPLLGGGGAARAVSVTMLSALVGRLVTGVAVDRLNARRVASLTLAAQAAGVMVLAGATAPPALYLGCALFGWGVGNLTTLPGVIVGREWPRESFAALIGLVVAINQFTFAFGPSLVGIVRDAAGSYAPALAVCLALELLAGAIVLREPVTIIRRKTSSEG